MGGGQLVAFLDAPQADPGRLLDGLLGVGRFVPVQLGTLLPLPFPNRSLSSFHTSLIDESHVLRVVACGNDRTSPEVDLLFPFRADDFQLGPGELVADPVGGSPPFSGSLAFLAKVPLGAVRWQRRLHPRAWWLDPNETGRKDLERCLEIRLNFSRLHGVCLAVLHLLALVGKYFVLLPARCSFLYHRKSFRPPAVVQKKKFLGCKTV